MNGQWWNDDNVNEPAPSTPPQPPGSSQPPRPPETAPTSPPPQPSMPEGEWGTLGAPVPAGNTQGSSNSGIPIGIAIAAILSLIGGLLVFNSLSGDESTEVVAQGEIFLERADEAGDDPFFDDYATLVSFDPDDVTPPGVVTPASSAAPASVAPPGPLTNAEILALSFKGGEPGLYGGTGNNATCNKAALIAFLETSPDKASAWAGAQGIATTDIRELVEGLTTVVLLADTRVTNHGFKNGVANPIQSVLQAGMAVMIDATGTPRVKCGCGNPLRRPIAQSRTVVLKGDPWEDFDQGKIATIEPADNEVETFVLRDPGSGTAVERPAGTSGEADVITSLSAPRPTDDLAVGAAAAVADSLTGDDTEIDPGVTDAPSSTTTAPLASTTTVTAPPSTLAGRNYCEKYGNYVAEAAQIWEGSDGDFLRFLQQAVADLKRSSPPELQDDWDLLDRVYQNITPDQIDTFEEDASAESASNTVVAHAETVCGIDFG